jgi:RND family efflux transporter MFP subunit
VTDRATDHAHEAHPEELGFELPQPVRSSRIRVLAIVAVVVAAVFAFGYLRRGHGESAAAEPGTAGHGAPRVETIKPTAIASDRALTLPGVARPLEETKVYPRSSGYVKRWLVDIGDKVAQGQLLAEIDTPELEAQLAQARAQVGQAKAALRQAQAAWDYSKANAARQVDLGNQKLVAQNTVEQAVSQANNDEANVGAQQANIVAAEANVNKLTEQVSYTRVIAPFAGTITARYVDRGAALIADAGTTPLFDLAGTDPIRVFIDVPQTVAPTVKAGLPAAITTREYGSRVFAGTVTRSAEALDPVLHTMSTELRIPNQDGALLPGMYVQAAITLPVPHKVLEIPATALYSDAHGLRIASVDPQHKVHFSKITIERDTGSTLWIATGISDDEQIVKIAVPSLAEGDTVDTAK